MKNSLSFVQHFKFVNLEIGKFVVSFFLCHEQVIYNQIPIYFWPKQILSPIYNKSTHRKIYCKLFVLSCKVESQVLVTFLNIQVVKIWFPAQNRRSGLYFDFNKEKNWVSHYKTLAQKLRKTVLKKENKIQIEGCSELYMGVAFLPQRKAFFSNGSLSPI